MDFEKIIAEARKSGMSFEDMAREFTNSLNETSNREEKEKNSRQSVIDNFHKHFDEAYRTRGLTFKDIAEAATALSAATTETGKTWDVDTINEYYEFILDILKNGPEFFTTLSELIDMLDGSGFVDMLKMKDNHEHKCDSSCGGNCTCKSNTNKDTSKPSINIDEAIIRKFLRGLDF